ncbi:MAG TPA: pYEATS domain-containing protein [Kofleriaceae bacterium]|jgi:hypothetical protein|nr:pYEATS domain-containing protein [Kofleriaceae bacterium]
MTLELKQSSEQKGSREWKWSVWLSGKRTELANVERVVYHLHPTFPDPIRTVTDRGTGFRLDETGWSEFEIVAHVAVKRGASSTLKARLELGRPAKPDAAHTVFISSSLADATWALELKRALETSKVRVVSADDASERGFPASLEDTLRKTSGVVMLMSDKASPWMRYELDGAARAGVPVIQVHLGKTETGEGVVMPELSDAQRVAREVMKRLTPSKSSKR